MQDDDPALSDQSVPVGEVPATLTEQAWRARLYDLNPWAKDLWSAAKNLRAAEPDPVFTAARRKATIERWRSRTWNAWADAILDLKEEAEAAGLLRREAPPGWMKEGSEPERTHYEFAMADFTNHSFDADADFASLRFPWETNFSGAKFGRADAPAKANFQRAAFHGPVQFKDCAFSKTANFRSATFLGEAWFTQAKFSGSALFDNARFFNGALFQETRFDRHTSFFKAAFTGTGGRPAGHFRHAVFRGPVSFSGAHFSGCADFVGLKSEVAFALAKTEFSQAPDFIDATFHEPPRLDDCRMPVPISESHLFSPARTEPYPADPRPPGLMRCFAVARDGHEHALLRKLRAMAADGKDHENELQFNAYEIAARRFWVDKPGTFWRPGARFWLGWLYGLTSDYGRSIARPLVGWLLTVGLFWGIFLFGTTDKRALAHGRFCHPSYEAIDGRFNAQTPALGGPAGQALILSFRNSVVIDRAEPSTSRRMYGCLYGLTGRSGAVLPVIPPAVTVLSAAQSVIAAVFLFLAGLAVRNTFRIK